MKKVIHTLTRILLIAIVAALVFAVGHFRGPKFPKEAHAKVTDFQPWQEGMGGMETVSGVPGADVLMPRNLRVNGLPVTIGGGSLEHAIVDDVLNYYRTRYALYKNQSMYYNRKIFGLYSVITTELAKAPCEEPCDIQFDDSIFAVMVYGLPGSDSVHYFTVETRKGFSFDDLLEQADDRWEVPDPRGIPQMQNGVREMIIKGDEPGQDTYTILYTNPGTVKMSELFYERGFISHGWKQDRLMKEVQSRAGYSSAEKMLYFRRDKESCFVFLSPDEENAGQTVAAMIYTGIF